MCHHRGHYFYDTLVKVCHHRGYYFDDTLVGVLFLYTLILY